MSSSLSSGQVAAIELQHRVNGWVCFLVGVPLNLALLQLIEKESSSELRLYSRLLKQTVVADLFYLLSSFLYMAVRHPLPIADYVLQKSST
jgi:Serpentine type 7TM GPCR chemoreceptor Srd